MCRHGISYILRSKVSEPDIKNVTTVPKFREFFRPV